MLPPQINAAMKLIKEFLPSVLGITLFCYLAVMMSAHFRYISIPNEPFDEESAMLAQIKKIVPPGSKFSFATNLRNDESSQRAYYETQFGWCPMILSDDISLNDHIIYYRSANTKDSISPSIELGDTLYQGAGNGYTLMLLHKTKTK